jgi:hypothetical protein
VRPVAEGKDGTHRPNKGAHQALIDLPIQWNEQGLEKADEVLSHAIGHLRCVEIAGIMHSETS